MPVTRPRYIAPSTSSSGIRSSHSLEGSSNNQNNQNNNNNSNMILSFPCKLYALLEDAPNKGFAHVISWQSTGKSFKIHDPETFSSHIMGGYMMQTKFKSFQRQLNIYGWKKVHHGPHKGGYVHKYFIRGQPELCHKIVRRCSNDNTTTMEASATSTRPSTVPTDPFVVLQGEDTLLYPSTDNMDPLWNFDAPTLSSSTSKHDRINSLMIGLGGAGDNHATTQPGHVRINTADLDFCFDDGELEGFVAMLHQEEDLFHMEDAALKPQAQAAVATTGSTSNPFQAVVEEEAARPSTPPTDSEESSHNSIAAVEAPDNDLADMETTTDHNFPFKLHMMLESAQEDGYSHIVSWVKKGSAFKVWNHKEFVLKVLPFYFDQSKYESFRRQLNLYGFFRIARGADRGVISHPHFVQGDRARCKLIKRKAQPKGSRTSSSAAAIAKSSALMRRPVPTTQRSFSSSSSRGQYHHGVPTMVSTVSV